MDAYTFVWPHRRSWVQVYFTPHTHNYITSRIVTGRARTRLCIVCLDQTSGVINFTCRRWRVVYWYHRSKPIARLLTPTFDTMTFYFFFLFIYYDTLFSGLQRVHNSPRAPRKCFRKSIRRQYTVARVIYNRRRCAKSIFSWFVVIRGKKFYSIEKFIYDSLSEPWNNNNNSNKNK